jgi:hypothetical protein
MEIFALATAALLASVTVPETVAPATCARTGVEMSTLNIDNTHTNRSRPNTIEDYLPGRCSISHINFEGSGHDPLVRRQ